MTRLRARDGNYRAPDGVAPGSIVSVFRVPPEVAGQRLDLFIMGQLNRTSRTRVQAIILASAFDEAGRRMRSSDRVRPEQKIFLWRPPWDETAATTEIPVLYEDAHLLAVDKPAFVPVHPTARYYNSTLIKLLESARPGAFLALGHRLDRETSGVLLVSKNAPCDRALKRMFELRTGVDKTYCAITWGVPHGANVNVPFRCTLPVELDPNSTTRVKMRVSEGGVYAATRFTVLEVRCGARGEYARVQCDLETGRQHQIRLHLASLGAPVVGDKLYGPDEGAFARAADGELTSADQERLELKRHALHAERLSLLHPHTGEPLSIHAPLPSDLSEFWEALPSLGRS